MSIITKSNLQVSATPPNNSSSASIVKKQRLQDVANPVVNIGVRSTPGKQWIGPITPYSLGGRTPEPGSIETLVPPQRYLQAEKEQAEAQGLVYQYTFNPTPAEGSGIPATSPPSTIPFVSNQILPENGQKIPYNLIVIGVLGLAGIYLLKKRKK